MLETQETCSECKNRLYEDIREVWCEGCGLVERENIDMGKKDFNEDGEQVILSPISNLGEPIQSTEIGKMVKKRW